MRYQVITFASKLHTDKIGLIHNNFGKNEDIIIIQLNTEKEIMAYLFRIQMTRNFLHGPLMYL